MQDSRLTAAVSLVRLAVGPEPALKYTEAFKAAAAAVESHVCFCTHLRDLSSNRDSSGRSSYPEPLRRNLTSTQWRLVEGHAVFGKDRAREIWLEPPTHRFRPCSPELAGDCSAGSGGGVLGHADRDKRSLSTPCKGDHRPSDTSAPLPGPPSDGKAPQDAQAVRADECAGPGLGPARHAHDCTAEASSANCDGPFQKVLEGSASFLAQRALHVQALRMAQASGSLAERAAAAVRFLERVDPQVIAQGAFPPAHVHAFLHFRKVCVSCAPCPLPAVSQQ